MRLIDADELLYRLEKIKEEFLDDGNYIAMCIAKAVIKMLKTEGTIPAVDAEPVRHGRWEEYPDKAHLRCTACKVEFLRNRMPETRNRCPNCGAKMDAKEDEP